MKYDEYHSLIERPVVLPNELPRIAGPECKIYPELRRDGIVDDQ